MIFNSIKKICKNIFDPRKVLIRVCLEYYYSGCNIDYPRLSFYVIPVNNVSVQESCDYDMKIVNSVSYLSSFINNYLVTKDRTNYYINVITLDVNTSIGDLSPKIKKIKLFNNAKLKLRLKKELNKFIKNHELSTEFEVTIKVK